MKLGQAGLELIKRFEGCKLAAYRCPAGIWTIGFGCTQGVHEGMTITEGQAKEMLVRHLEPLERELSSVIDADLSQNQWDAVESLAYNIGFGNFRASTLLKHLNAGAFGQAADQFRVWNKVNGEPCAGLTRRREAECELFLRG